MLRVSTLWPPCSYIAKAVSGPGIIASDAESRKRVKYSQLNTAMYVFQPIAIETLGAFGTDASDFIRKLGHKLQTVTQDTRSTMFLLQRLSVAVQRGNAACVLGTIAEDGSLSHFFDF